MFFHVKELQYQAKPERPDPVFADVATANVLGLVDRLMPSPDGAGAEAATVLGMAIDHKVRSSAFDALTGLGRAGAPPLASLDEGAAPSPSARGKAGGIGRAKGPPAMRGRPFGSAVVG